MTANILKSNSLADLNFQKNRRLTKEVFLEKVINFKYVTKVNAQFQSGNRLYFWFCFEGYYHLEPSFVPSLIVLMYRIGRDNTTLFRYS